MDLCDSNVWLALALEDHGHHPAARKWFDSRREPESAAFCRATQQSFLRLLTSAAVMRAYELEPRTNLQAWEVYESLLEDDRVDFLDQEPPGLEVCWRGFAGRATASPKLWMDAYLASFAVAGRLRMVTTDAAFQQFRGLDLLLLA